MNKKSNLTHEKIKYILNRSAARLELPVLVRLRNARVLTLERYEARHASPTFAWAGNFTSNTTGTPQKIHFLATAVLLAALLLGAVTYYNHVANDDTSDVDIAILTDDLPMHVYID